MKSGFFHKLIATFGAFNVNFPFAARHAQPGFALAAFVIFVGFAVMQTCVPVQQPAFAGQPQTEEPAVFRLPAFDVAGQHPVIAQSQQCQHKKRREHKAKKAGNGKQQQAGEHEKTVEYSWIASKDSRQR